MKRCPKCRRDYFDESLAYCLDDGSVLVDGPASIDEPATAVIAPSVTSEGDTRLFTSSENKTDPAIKAVNMNRRSLIAGIVGVIVVTALGIGSYLYYGRGSGKQIDSVAVLPFVNETGNPDSEYLSDGMTETLISSLSQLPQLNVRARSSVFRFKGSSTDIHEIARQLNVGAIVSGRISQHGQDTSLYAELIDISSDKVTWSKTYNRPMTNLVALQGEIANDVVQALRAKLTVDDQQKLDKSGTSSAEAYQYYLQGQYHFKKRGPDEVGKAIDNFNKAIAIDPKYALAYAALSFCYGVDSTPEPPGPGRIAKHDAAAKKAIEIDPNLSDAHLAMSGVYDNAGDWTQCEAEYKKAIELDPNNADAHHWYGEMLSSLGRSEESMVQIDKAIDLEPFSVVFNWDRIRLLYHARRYDDSIAQAKKVMDLDPNGWGPRADRQIIRVYRLQKRYAEALDESERLIDVSDRDQEYKAESKRRIAVIRENLKTSGPPGYWKGTIDFIMWASQGNPDPFDLAERYAAVGDKDEAFKWLEKAVEEGTTEIKTYPGFDPLRDDPRFGELVKKAGYPWP
jgi:FimV-like protein